MTRHPGRLLVTFLIFTTLIHLKPHTSEASDTLPVFSSVHKLRGIVTELTDTGPFSPPGKDPLTTRTKRDTSSRIAPDTTFEAARSSRLQFFKVLKKFIEDNNEFDITLQSISESNQSSWSFFANSRVSREEFIPGETSSGLRDADEFEEFKGVFSGVNASYPIMGKDGNLSISAGSNYGKFKSNAFTTRKDEYIRPRVKGNFEYSLYPNFSYDRNPHEVTNQQKALQALNQSTRDVSSHVSNLLVSTLVRDFVEQIPRYKNQSKKIMISIRDQFQKGLISQTKYYQGYKSHLAIQSTAESILSRWEKLSAETPDTPLTLPSVPQYVSLPERKPVFLKKLELKLNQARYERDNKWGHSLDFSSNYLQEWRNSSNQENWEVKLNYSFPIATSNSSEHRTVSRLKKQLRNRKKRAKKSRTYLPRRYRKSVAQFITSYFNAVNAWRQLQASAKKWEYGEISGSDYLNAINQALSAEITLTKSYVSTFQRYIQIKSKYQTEPLELLQSLEPHSKRSIKQ